MFETIKLTNQEQSYFDKINWNIEDLLKQNNTIIQINLEMAGRIAISLFERNIIPSCRLKWFADKDYNIGGYGKSRMERFIKNAGSIHNMVRDIAFMKYLKYFLFGPILPEETIKGFVKIFQEDLGTSGQIMDHLCAFTRREIRDKQLSFHTLGYDPAEEFYKLALEIGYNYPEVIHKAAKTAKRK